MVLELKPHLCRVQGTMASTRKHSSERYISNPVPDYATFCVQLRSSASEESGGSGEGQDYSFGTSTEHRKLCCDIRTWLHENIGHILKAYPPSSVLSPTSVQGHSKRDFSIYVGTGGNAYLHWKLSKFFAVEKDGEKEAFHRQKAVEAVTVALSLLPTPSSEGIAFFLGGAGVCALAAVIFSEAGNSSKVEQYLHQLMSYLPHALHSSAVDEILYGRAGFLFCLLLVRKHVGRERCERFGVDAAMRKVFDAIVKSGKGNSGAKPPDTSAMCFYFYGTDYHGAAHGTAGILYMLLQFPEWCREPNIDPWIRKTLDRLLSFQFPSGNFASASDSGSDKLLHWCHGAPGTVYTLLQAYKVYGDPKFKTSFELALKSVWERGILKKGNGLCHGTSGSVYAFLIAYRHLDSEEYLYNALKMAEVMSSEEVKKEVAAAWDPQRYCPGVPDFPYSLMEGLGGTICLHCDLLHPEMATFPGYEGDI